LDKTQRLRDPVHGLITFRKGVPLDELAWDLLDTPEFGRLRRIKQLGVSEFVYPGATHTRFIHSVGVFHVARQLLDVVKREIGSIGEAFDETKAEIAVLAALLHDLGHGPFSHTFEGVQEERGAAKNHEKWSAEIISSPLGNIKPILDRKRSGLAEDIAELLGRKNPKDIYHAIVSSSFDADRLDYLRRDKMMSGTGAGAIDFDWLLEHVRVRSINLDAPDGTGDEDSVKVPTFCIDVKALPAAEQFLLARYTLHEQVYFHKTTRCVEKMIARLLKFVSEKVKLAASGLHEIDILIETGLETSHPLIKFFSSLDPTVLEYLQLDDVVLLASFERMTNATDTNIANLAKRLRDRNLYKALDCRAFDPAQEWQATGIKKIDKRVDSFSGATIKDGNARLSIYTHIGSDEEKAHKKLRILDRSEKTLEITAFGGIAAKLPELFLTRYYFENPEDRVTARGLGERR
jgi:uncharacterized protein